jgi:hypothetical protein
MRQILRQTSIAAIAAAFALSQPAFAQTSGGASGGAVGTGGSAASTAGTSGAGASGQSLGAGSVPTQPGVTPGSSNPGGVNGALGNSGLSRQAPGTNSLGAANSGGGATVGQANPDKPGSLDVIDPLQKEVDKKMNGICRGC